MKFSLEKNSKHIIFHVKNLTIQTVELKHETAGIVQISKNFDYEKNQYHVLESASEFNSGTYELTVVYTGKTNIGIVGMYQATYKEDDTTK